MVYLADDPRDDQGPGAVVICPVDRGSGTGDIINRDRNTAVNRQQIVTSVILTVIVLGANLGGILWALNW